MNQFTNVTARQITVAGQKFLPGETWPIPADQEEVLRTTSVFRAKMIVPGQVEMPAVRELPDLSGYDSAKARVRVSAELSADTLMAWGEKETRPEVCAAIVERMKHPSVK